jgi:hypothetical protein
MNTEHAPEFPHRLSRRLATAAFALALCAAGSAHAGSIFITGHDPDFHAFLGGNAAGAQKIVNAGLDYARDGNSAPILYLQSDTSNIGLGDHTDSEQGIIASGYSAGTSAGSHYVKVDASGFASANFSLYSAVLLPSDHGGTLTESDLAAVNARTSDLIGYLNAGGGLVAFAEDGFHTGRPGTGAQPLFGFLPFVIANVSLSQSESGFTVTPFGTSLGLAVGDVNGNASHNIFTATGGMNVVDRDGSGNIITLAYRGQISPTGTVPLPAPAALLGSALVALWRGRGVARRAV